MGYHCTETNKLDKIYDEVKEQRQDMKALTAIIMEYKIDTNSRIKSVEVKINYAGPVVLFLVGISSTLLGWFAKAKNIF